MQQKATAEGRHGCMWPWSFVNTLKKWSQTNTRLYRHKSCYMLQFQAGKPIRNLLVWKLCRRSQGVFHTSAHTSHSQCVCVCAPAEADVSAHTEREALMLLLKVNYERDHSYLFSFVSPLCSVHVRAHRCCTASLVSLSETWMTVNQECCVCV